MKTHGMSSSPEYRSYKAAKRRCNNPNDKWYHIYGGRGIKFLFKSFEEFYNEVGPKPTPDHTIDRINNDKNYESGNIRWATRSEQFKNSKASSREHQVKAGKAAGFQNVISGHLASLRTPEHQSAAGRIGGKIAAGAGFHKTHSIKDINGKSFLAIKVLHKRWHLSRNRTNPNCSLCQGVQS